MSDSVKNPLPGQFRLRALFVLMTLAAVAAWIMSLSIDLQLRVLFLVFLWSSFQIGQMLSFKFPVSRTDRVNMAVVDILGQLIAFAAYASPLLITNRPLRNLEYACLGLLSLGPALGIWWDIRTIRQVAAEKDSVGAVASKAASG
jgi:hypothetical protein